MTFTAKRGARNRAKDGPVDAMRGHGGNGMRSGSEGAGPSACWGDPGGEAASYCRLDSGLLVPSQVAERLQRIDLATVTRYAGHLRNAGKAPATVQKYCHDLRAFAIFMGRRYLSVSLVREWLEDQKKARHINTVNSAISALNGLFRWMNRPDCFVSFFRRQEPPYRSDERDLNAREFLRLVDAADGRMRALALTLRGTGIRVSELRFFTVEAVRGGVVNVDNKGKARTVFLDPKTKTLLLRYCEKRGIRSGVIFRNSFGAALSRTFIWRSFKKLAVKAGMEPSKVFPHNLRHLFAVEQYKIDHDIEALRLDMGHTLISTTQRYLKETASAHFLKLTQRAATAAG